MSCCFRKIHYFFSYSFNNSVLNGIKLLHYFLATGIRVRLIIVIKRSNMSGVICTFIYFT